MAGKVKVQMVLDAKNNTKPAFDQANKQLNAFSSQAKVAAGVLAGAFSVSALAGWIKESTLATAQMGKMATLSGTSAEQFQGWAYAAKSVGIEQDKMGDIFKDVQDKVGDFLQTGGGTLADFFENIAPKVGVTAEQFRNLSGPDALGLYVSSLEKANLSQSEMTFYMESIANDATLLLPLLRDNAAGYLALRKEAEELGLVLSGDQVRDAEQFRQSLQTLGAVSEGAGRQISAELLPTLNEVSGLLIDVSKDGGYTAQVANVLSFALKVLASAAIIGGNAFGSLGRFIAGAAAAAVSAASGDFKQAGDIMRMVGEDNARETGAAMQRIEKIWTGAYEGVGKQAASVSAQIDQSNKEMSESTKVTTDKMKESYKDLSKVAKQEISKLTSAQREANSELERLQKERLEIDERYSKLRSALSGATGGDPSYGQAQALKVAARNALQAGDIEGAKSQAEAAAKILADLAAAGENTYGLQGFANELQAIEAEANRLEQTAVDQKLASITTELEKVTRLADVKITVGMSPEEIEGAKQQMQELAAVLSQSLVITPTIAPVSGLDYTQPYTLVDPGPAPQPFATGGAVYGPGSGTSDSIPALLSNGEYVIKAAAVRRLGKGYLDLINNGLPIKRFADGGAVEAVSGMAAPRFPHLGRLDINAGGQTIPAYIELDFAKKLSRTALKLGRTHKS